VALNSTKKAIFAKTETSYGNAISTSATDAILVSNLDVQPFQGDQVDRNLVKPYFGASDILTANGRTRVTFGVELAGTGTAPTASAAVPQYGSLLRACAMSETLVANTASGSDPSNAMVQYRPVSESISSVTIRCNYDGVLHVVRGCRGNVRLQCQTGQIPMLMFEFEGIYVSPTDSAYADSIASVNYAGIASPLIFNSTNTTNFRFLSQGNNEVDPCLQSLEIDVGNTVNYRELVGCSKQVLITNRRSTGTAVIDAVLMATKNYFEAANANETGVLKFTHGTTPGNRVSFRAPRANLTSVSYAESDNVLQYNIPFVLLPDRLDMAGTGDREFVISVF
jgi:hypothetical protein